MSWHKLYPGVGGGGGGASPSEWVTNYTKENYAQMILPQGEPVLSVALAEPTYIATPSRFFFSGYFDARVRIINFGSQSWPLSNVLGPSADGFLTLIYDQLLSPGGGGGAGGDITLFVENQFTREVIRCPIVEPLFLQWPGPSPSTWGASGRVWAQTRVGEYEH